MPNFSLLFAHTPEIADHSCRTWQWDKVGDLGHHEYRRPDTGERVRFVLDSDGHGLNGLRWNTRVYLSGGLDAGDWRRRRDASHIMGMLDAGFFVEADPVLPPPRSRRSKDADALSEIKRNLARLEQRK